MGRCKPLGSLNSFVGAGAASVGSQFGEASFTFGGQKLLLAVTFGEGSGTHSSTLAWRIPGMGEPGGLQSMGS